MKKKIAYPEFVLKITPRNGGFILFYLFITFLQWGCKNEGEITKPNIILIMADDLGYGEIGCYGNMEINTPNLDYLANNGVKFTDFHSNGSVCTPTRAALLTGNYQQRSGMEGIIYVRGETREVGLDPNQHTIADFLKGEGYVTGVMGKWHLGYNEEFNPTNLGFDEFYGYLSGNVDYHSHYDNSGIYDWWHNLDSLNEEGYSTDLISKHSVDFIEKNKDKPFFLYVPHEAPHVPFQGRTDQAYRFSNNEFTYQGPVEDKERAYREMVEAMDDGIGMIIKKLKELEIEDNTLVFFLSDNGAEKFGNNGVLNGTKGSLLEGGHRVPAIAYWKNKINPKITKEVLMTMDLLPTILSIAKAPLAKFDGINFSEILFSETEVPLEDRPVFWRYKGNKAVRQKDWKLIVKEKDTVLYNLSTDLEESKNLYSHNNPVAKKLIKSLKDWENEVGLEDKMITL
ncbi:sulfatase-like hydrolase/transferase [Zobellia uliginosa]|uniref:sulfatase-like hydrolase/transferase n=1 Tax=Zobellia uliginosa TaxID=143224 RepID=UPI0026E18083|nr:sulfatase-like hydrolase/transferase [Zobellia uliginosa]MDO6518091.1 sulfatase-like hydrolase/transferase [Zobellia uliginosa]